MYSVTLSRVPKTTGEVMLSLTLANAMVQKGTTVQCQPLSGRDIRRRQRHGRQQTHTHTHSDKHYSFHRYKNLSS